MKTIERDRDTVRSEGRVVHRSMTSERRARRAAIALTGMLGVAWAALIVSRYPGLMPG